MMKKLTKALHKAYIWLFIRNFINYVTDEAMIDKVIFHALKKRGYNNYENQRLSGEAYLINIVLRKFSPNVCIDVGANVGSFASSLLEAFEDITVFSFEPLESPFCKLMEVKKTFGNRLIAINKGVGDKNETLKIHFSESATVHASFSEEVKNVSYVINDISTEVDVVSLDRYFSTEAHVDNIDFIKIDTEGFEFEVLIGANEIIKRFKPKLIQIEFNWHQIFKEKTLFSFSEILDGYKLYQLLPNRLVERDPKDPMSNIYLFSNFVFIRSDLVNLI